MVTFGGNLLTIVAHAAFDSPYKTHKINVNYALKTKYACFGFVFK